MLFLVGLAGFALVVQSRSGKAFFIRDLICDVRPVRWAKPNAPCVELH